MVCNWHIYILLNTLNPNNGQITSVYLYYNSICGGEWRDYGTLDDYSKLIIEDPNSVVIPI